MSQSDLLRPQTFGMGATAVPLLIVGVMVLVNGTTDPRSSAADVQAPPDPAMIIRASLGALTETQQEALRYRKQIPALTKSDSPFPFVEADPIRFSDDAGFGLPGIEQPIAKGPTFIVSVMMSGNAGNIALINGKAHREGDELKGGWAVQQINAQTKQVVLVDGRGETITLDLNRPAVMPRPTP